MRALYYLLAAAVVFFAVCESADLVERLATRSAPGRRPMPVGAAPELKPAEWHSAPASGEASAVGKGKGVLIDKATGKRYRTP